MSARIPLRYYRLLSRPPYLEIEPGTLLVRLPIAFGGRVRWAIPMGAVAVVDAEQASGSADDPGDGWVFATPIRVPYAATTSPNARPNLHLLFATEQQVPPLRRFGARSMGLSFRGSRRPAGVQVQGIHLRALDPVLARDALLAAGAQRVQRPWAWLRDRYPTTADPARVEAARSRRKRWRLVSVAGFTALILVNLVRLVAGKDSTLLFAALGLALLTLGGLPLWARHQDRVKEKASASPPS